MTPKEKAIELFDKYAMYLRANLMYNEEANEDAKQCALIAVNYIINSNPHSNPFNTEVYSTFSYWQEVKQEIEKL
jgi:hypothetical protein